MSDIDRSLCDEALKIVQGARREKYDKPERNFERIALAWQAITDRAYTASEVALMFVALKLVREAHAHQRDNLVDGIGYLLCADAVQPKDSEKSPYQVQKDWRAKAFTQAQEQTDAKAMRGSISVLSQADTVVQNGIVIKDRHGSFQSHPAAESFNKQWTVPRITDKCTCGRKDSCASYCGTVLDCSCSARNNLGETHAPFCQLDGWTNKE